MKTTILILSVLFGLVGLNNTSAQKTAVHWYLPTMSFQEAGQLKGYDLVIIDPEIIFNSRASLETLRRDNPDVKIYCYFNPVEWFNPMFPDKPWSVNIVNFLNQHDEWFLHGKDGQRLSFWKGMQTMNCLANCPKIAVYSLDKKINYIEFITDRFINDILKEYRFNGVVTDNLWYKIHWLGKYGVNKSGFDYGTLPDKDSVSLDSLWRQGMNYCLSEIKKFAGDQDFNIIGNPGHLEYNQYCSGKMFENFPEIYLNEKDTLYHAWFENLSNAKTFPDGPCIFNAGDDNYTFALCSAMLLDNVYFSYSQNTKYDSKWNLNLGKPLGTAKLSVASETFYRDYENGTVMVYPVGQIGWVMKSKLKSEKK